MKPKLEGPGQMRKRESAQILGKSTGKNSPGRGKKKKIYKLFPVSPIILKASADAIVIITTLY